MGSTLKLTVITGPHRGERFCFRGPSRCTVGRAPECFIQLSGEARDQTISRYHCQLNVDMPFIAVNDLSSRNGTYINGHEVPTEPVDLKDVAGCSDPDDSRSGILKQGDILTLGGTSFQLDVVDCAVFDKSNENDPPLWKPRVVAKKDCAIFC